MTTRRIIVVVIVIGVIAALVIAFAAQSPARPTGPNANGTANAPNANTLPRQATPEKINAEVGPNDPQIYMLEPQDGSKLDSPFFLRIGVSNFPIPISAVKIHVAVDLACTPAGEVVPKDDQHISLPLGVMENSRFALPLGPHRLCIQASTQDDKAMEGPGMTHMIDVIIQSVE
ncbi:MAG TPA: hypothetical protein VMP08_24760 [Anaerolineae bacterium]|nr:hypothetical protein [Anaerolineae bacterium]